MNTSAARLEVVAGKAVGMSILVEDELVIGRHSHGSGQLANDDEISRSHARLTFDASGFLGIEDLGSTNGTFVNGLRINSPQTLSESDTIEMGGTTLVVREVPAPSLPGPPAPTDKQSAARADATYVGAVPPSPPPTTEPREVLSGEQSPDLKPAATPTEEADFPAPEPAADDLHADEDAALGMPAAPDFEKDADAREDGPPAPAPDPSTEDAVAPAPTLSLQIEVDFVAREARLFLNGASAPVRLVLDAGVWRTAPPTPTEEKGGPPA